MGPSFEGQRSKIQLFSLTNESSGEYYNLKVYTRNVIFKFEETYDREDKVEEQKLKRPFGTTCSVVSASSEHLVKYV